MQRREFLRLGGFTAAGLLLPPALLAKNASDADYHLVVSAGGHHFSDEQPEATNVMYYNQSIPGPVLRLKQGIPATIKVTNQLSQPTSVHWHGLRIANAMDGVPEMTQPLIQPGESFIYRFTPPDAGTFWYHSHQRAWEQIAKGLAGILIVEESNPPQVDHDYLLAIDDWLINQQLQIDEESLGSMHDWAHAGRMGNIVTVNGRFDTTYAVEQGDRVRLRLVNIANARTMNLKLNSGNPAVVAIDGQPIAPYSLAERVIQLAPGQRADLILDMIDESQSLTPIELLVNQQVVAIAHFAYAKTVKRSKPLTTAMELPANPQNRIAINQIDQSLPLDIEGGAMGGLREAIYQGKKYPIRELAQQKQIWALNGIAGLATEPLFRAKRNQTIEIVINNNNNWPHAMHIHGHHFQSRSQPDIWRDTTLLQRGEKQTIRFVADNPGKWLIHCHMIEHQAAGMLSWFEVS